VRVSSFFLCFEWFWKGCKPNSVCASRRRESFVLATDTRNRFRFHETWSGQLRGFLFGLAPDGVFPATPLARRAVRSYRTFSPLPRFLRTTAVCFSVALSVEEAFDSPPACISGQTGVTWHRALWCSDFPLKACAKSDSPPFQNRLKLTRYYRFNKRGRSSAPQFSTWRGSLDFILFQEVS
jgi:hypothetical protein